MVDVADLTGEGLKLSDEKKYAEAIGKLHQARDRIIDKSTQIVEQIRIQYAFGCCYCKQAIKAKDENEADKLSDKVIKHYQEWLQFK